MVSNLEFPSESTGDCDGSIPAMVTQPALAKVSDACYLVSNWPRATRRRPAGPLVAKTLSRFCTKCYNNECSLIVIFDHMGCGVIGSIHV